MKFFLKILGFVLLALQVSAAVPKYEYVNLNPVTMVHLTTLKSQEIHLTVAYPGASISGLCSIELRTQPRLEAEGMKELVGRLNLSELASGGSPMAHLKIVDGAIIVNLPIDGMYLDGFRIRSLHGEALGQVVRKVVGDFTAVVAVAGLCN